ncbi:hypothetical protein PENTCL1PPCAC_991 [Pristionchus entomophagus]|uniref:Uncharacterized protein n=1 Tax=Pristionchus entomophagus TaxID=358040 RepID=A0AAV5SGL8_9BILA|nr:hypothetical protein PENTCL1PPCAC_991 [Pristionchus entomophagus]
MVDQFIGTWVCTKADNVEAYFREVGATKNLSKALSHVKGTLTFEIEGDEWTMTFNCPVKNHTYKFRLGQEFNDTTFDGRPVSSKFEFDGNKLVEIEKGTNGGPDTRKEITITGNTLTMVDQCGLAQSTSAYEKAAPGLIASF